MGWAAAASTAAALLLRRLDGESVGLFYLYYQPLIPVAAMLWAWAAAVALFEARSIKYDVCFSARDQQRLLPSAALYHVSGAQKACTSACIPGTNRVACSHVSSTATQLRRSQHSEGHRRPMNGSPQAGAGQPLLQGTAFVALHPYEGSVSVRAVWWHCRKQQLWCTC